MVSPMMVERRWPTCISFATLGDEKSTIAFFFSAGGGSTPCLTMFCTRAACQLFEIQMLTKPATGSTFAKMPSLSHSCIAAASVSATSFGALIAAGMFPLALSMPKSAIAVLFWKSPSRLDTATFTGAATPGNAFCWAALLISVTAPSTVLRLVGASSAAPAVAAEALVLRPLAAPGGHRCAGSATCVTVGSWNMRPL